MRTLHSPKRLRKLAALSLLSLCVGCYVAFGAQGDASAMHGLVLTSDVAHQRYCKQSGGNARLVLSLDLTFRNTGGEKLILPKLNNQVGGLEIAPDAPGQGTKTPVLIDIDRMVISRKPPPDVPGDDFVRLRPGKSFLTHATVGISVTPSASAFWGVFGPGEYTLSVIVPTWFDSLEVGMATRDRWKRYGYLEIDSVKAQPIRFTVEANPTVQRCGPER